MAQQTLNVRKNVSAADVESSSADDETVNTIINEETTSNEHNTDSTDEYKENKTVKTSAELTFKANRLV